MDGINESVSCAPGQELELPGICLQAFQKTMGKVSSSGEHSL